LHRCAQYEKSGEIKTANRPVFRNGFPLAKLFEIGKSCRLTPSNLPNNLFLFSKIEWPLGRRNGGSRAGFLFAGVVSVEEKRVNRFAKALVCFAAVTLVDAQTAPAQQAAAESEAKARFLANAPSFVEWPTAVFATPTTPLSICVHGDFSFGTVLAEFTRGESVKGRQLEVKWVRAEQSLAGCQVIFVTRSLAKRYSKLLESVKDSGALTVGEDPDFLKAGGMVNLEPTGKGLTFDVNMDAVLRSHLKISSQLLSLARRVLHGVELARS